MAWLVHHREVQLRATSGPETVERSTEGNGETKDGATAAVAHGRAIDRQRSPRENPSFGAPPPATHYVPQVVVATCLVAVFPLAAVWELRARGVISSAWVGVPLAIVLSLLASLAGSAYWQRRRSSGDLMFSELLLWGWLRRLYLDHQVSNARKRLGLVGTEKPARDPQLTSERERIRLLRQLAAAIDGQDVYTDGHSRRVARHATMTARKMGLSHEQVATIQLAALVHDVGKLRVPRRVLNKPSQLSAAEFQIVKRHPEQGADMLAGLRNLELAAIVRHHHERLDGSGYPDGLRGSEIPLGARIVAVVDMFDAITAPRPYRPAQPHRRAFETLAKEAGTHLDPEVVSAFRSCYSGRRPLAWWMTVTALLEHVAWPQSASAARIRPSSRDMLSTTATTMAVAAVAVAAPIAPPLHTVREPSPSPAAAIPPPQVQHRHVHRAAAAHHPSVRPIPSLKPPPPLHGRTPAPPLGSYVTHHRVLTPTTRKRPAAPTKPMPPKPVSPPSKTPPSSTPTTPSAAPVAPPTTPQSPPTSTVTTTSPPTPTTTTTTTTPSVVPTSKDQCRNGGYAQYGFQNQGQCIAFVEHQH